MDNNIIKIDEENLKNDLKGVIRKTIEETLNTMLDEEAAELCNAERHERTDERRNYRSGHYHRKLLTSAGEVDLSVPKLPWPRSRPPSSSATGAGNRPWRSLSSRCTWREYPCAAWKTSRSSCGAGNMFVDGIYLKRSWGGEMTSVSVLVAIGVSEDGYREIRRRTRVVGCLQKHPRLGYENMQACFRIARLAAFSRTGNLP